MVEYIREGVSLFPNQKNNVNALIKRRRALLTDKTGAGKTLSVLYAFSLLLSRGYVKTLLVLTPRSAYEKAVWRKDIEKFTTLSCITLDELLRLPPESVTDYDVVVAKHTSLKRDLPLLRQIASLPSTLVCVDEMHAFKNPKAAVSKALKEAVKLSRNFWGMTATVLSRNLQDTYHILHTIRPGILGTFRQFKERFCVIKKRFLYRAGCRVEIDEIIGLKNEEEFKGVVSSVVITGESYQGIDFHYVGYDLTDSEASLYRTIAQGIDMREELTPEEWLRFITTDSAPPAKEHQIKEVDKYSSRFIYLQTATDGVLTSGGFQTNCHSTKIDKLITLLSEIGSRGESVLVYFDYYATLEAVEARIKSEKGITSKILLSTGKNPLKEGILTEESVKAQPHVVLCTKSASESVSYYYINHVVFFHIPTTPSTFSQFCGRIVRKNTLFPNDLHCHIFLSENIDKYKLMYMSTKAYQLEQTTGYDSNIPDDYKVDRTKEDIIDIAKNVLLWSRY